MRAIVVVLASCMLAGCIEPSLVECSGGIACPDGKVCGPSGGCFDPDELSACDGIDDGMPCDGGFCIESICVPDACGNHAITPGEVCDDGNTVNGDGCSADCRSDESCGNNIADLPAGEQCDDGNDLAGDACEPGCLLPRCGDGIVDGIEECDPTATLSTTRTCDDFGYYGGSLSCNDICRLDPTVGCTGRCGDGVVQSGNEECDGAPPASTCLDFGYDLGALGCSARCGADVVGTCDRFGWEDLGLVPVPMRFAGDGNTVVGYINNGFALFESGGTSLETGSGFTAADVRGSTILRSTATGLQLRASVGTAFSALPALPSGTVVDVELAPDLTPMVLTSNPCAVHVFDGSAWTTTAVPANCKLLVARSTTNYVVAHDTELTWQFLGGPRSISASAMTVDFRADDQIRIITSGGGVLSRFDLPQVGPASPTLAIANGVFGMAVSRGDEVYALDTSVFEARVHRVAPTRNEQITIPSTTGAPNGVFLSRDGTIYATGNGRLYRFSALTRTFRTAPSGSDIATSSAVSLGADGTLAFCSRDVWSASGSTWQKLSPTSAGVCRAIWARSPTDIYVTRDAAATSRLFHWNGSTLTEDLNAGAPIDATQIVGDATTVVVLTTTGMWRARPTLWQSVEPMPTGCTAYAIAMANGQLYAAGGCTGGEAVVWRLAGSTWTRLYTLSLPQVFGSLQVTADGVVFAANGQSKVVIGTEGGTWTVHEGVGYRLAGTLSTAMYVTTSQQLRRWNGSAWELIRMDANLSVEALTANDRDLVVFGSVIPNPTVRWLSYLTPP